MLAIFGSDGGATTGAGGGGADAQAVATASEARGNRRRVITRSAC